MQGHKQTACRQLLQASKHARKHPHMLRAQQAKQHLPRFLFWKLQQARPALPSNPCNYKGRRPIELAPAHLLYFEYWLGGLPSPCNRPQEDPPCNKPQVAQNGMPPTPPVMNTSKACSVYPEHCAGDAPRRAHPGQMHYLVGM